MIAPTVPELTFAEDLSQQLSLQGLSKLYYVTAEMQPFSNAQRPDILYKPACGAHGGQDIFIEIKLSTKPPKTLQDYEAIIEHRDFAEEYLGKRIYRYLFITKAMLPIISKKLLEKRSIHVIDNVETVHEVISAMRVLGILPG